MRAADDVVWCNVEGEIVLFNASDERYYGLNEVAAQIWRRLNEGASPDVVVHELVAEYEVEEHAARPEVDRLVGELLNLRMLVQE